MIAKTIKFEDFDGNQREMDFHFHLTTEEFVKMTKEGSDSFQNRIQKMIETEDQYEIFSTFKDLLVSAVGKKSEDGLMFVKSDEVKDMFRYSPAADALIMELISTEGLALEFMSGLLPKDARKVFEEKMNEKHLQIPQNA